MNRAKIIINLYNKYGSANYIGENMSQIDHALQCAYYAKKFNYDKDIITAALLHDIGHIVNLDNKANYTDMNNLGDLYHEHKGAEYLTKLGYNKRICNIVKNHVDAKRYLYTTNFNYIKKLSNASLQTLDYQGGKMSIEEINNFRKNRYYTESIIIRYIDDVGKKIKKSDYGKIEDYYEFLLL